MEGKEGRTEVKTCALSWGAEGSDRKRKGGSVPEVSGHCRFLQMTDSHFSVSQTGATACSHQGEGGTSDSGHFNSGADLFLLLLDQMYWRSVPGRGRVGRRYPRNTERDPTQLLPVGAVLWGEDSRSKCEMAVSTALGRTQLFCGVDK